MCAASLLCEAADSQKPSPPSPLVAAASSGDVNAVREIVEADSFAPDSVNALKALRLAKVKGHQEIVRILEAEIREYVESGALYTVPLQSTIKSMREKLSRDPPPVRWEFQIEMVGTFITGFYSKMSTDSEHLFYPVARHFDQKEMQRHVNAAIETLRKELSEQDKERKSER